MLPTFLGIGCYRSGSTWLHELLDSHPDAYVPKRRKEIHFFISPNYERGLQWYEGFFPKGQHAKRYKAIGEIGPGYIYRRECIDRIASLHPTPKFLVLLRDPIERAYSHYRWRARFFSTPPPFLELVEREPGILQYGLYARHLELWIRAFGRKEFLILLLEDARANLGETRRQVAEFLGLDFKRFPTDAGVHVSNVSEGVARPELYLALARAYRWLIRHDMEGVFKPLKTLSKSIVKTGEIQPLPPMDNDIRSYLRSFYERPNKELSNLLDLDLDSWS